MARKIEERVPMAAGIGESKIFAAPEGTFAENPVLDLHVGGVLVRELPVEMQGRIVYQQTDEGIAANNEGKSDAQVSVGAGAEDKALQQRRDQIKDAGYEPYLARDMMKELCDKHVAPGMRGKYLSPTKIKERSGTGDYEVVKGADGQPVTYKGMVLGQMPEQRAKARNKFYQDKSREMLRENDRRFSETAGGTKGATVESSSSPR